MARLRALVAATVGALAFTATARAADPPQWTPPPDIQRAVTPVALSPSWYLRADFGYRIHTINGASTAIGFPAPIDNQLGNSFAGGVGAGFKWRQLRTDLTVDYGADATYTGTGGGADASAKIRTITGLANFYYDIGTWWGFTPYIGAGAGVAHVRMFDYQSATTPPLSNVAGFGRYNIAWALMAGVDYQFLPNLSVDFGYRFLDQGAAQTATDASGNLTLDKLQSHEFRVGLRWMYDSPSSYAR